MRRRLGRTATDTPLGDTLAAIVAVLVAVSVVEAAGILVAAVSALELEGPDGGTALVTALPDGAGAVLMHAAPAPVASTAGLR